MPSKIKHQSVNIFEELSSVTENESKSVEINIVLMTEERDKNEILTAEASKLPVVDKACTKTVAGEVWYMNYIKYLPCEFKNQIQSVESNTLSLEMGTKCFLTERSHSFQILLVLFH